MRASGASPSARSRQTTLCDIESQSIDCDGATTGEVRAGHLALAAIFFTAISIYGSLVPFHFQSLSLSDGLLQFRQTPFLQLSIDARADWVANILLFVPLGYFWLGSMSQGRSRLATASCAVLLVPALIGLSVVIEFTQQWFPPRTVSQNDIVAESLGALFGVVGWLLLGEPSVAWVSRYLSARRAATQIQWLLQAYLLGFVIYSLLPLDLTISVTELYRKARDGRVQIIPFADLQLSLQGVIGVLRDVVLAIPIGALCAISWCRKDEALRPFATSCLAGTMIFSVIELAQVFVYSRHASASDVLISAIGVTLGVALAYRYAGIENWNRGVIFEPRMTRAVAWIMIVIAYVAGLLAAFWAPYDFLQDGELIRQRLQATIQRVPGASLYAGTELNAIIQVLARLLAYAPLGAILVCCSFSIAGSKTARRIVLGTGFLFSGLLATLIELGQVLLPTRIADFSEVPICLVGSAVGMVVVWRLLSATCEAREPTTLRPLVSSDPLRMAPTARADRVAGMDGLRAIACLAVFAVHLQQLTGTAGKWGSLNWNFLLENGRVALFFMLSGALLSISLWKTDFAGLGERWLSRYVTHRLLRIIPAYFACLLAIILWKRHWQGGGEILDSLLHIGLVHNYRANSFYSLAPPFWTIAVQAQFYVLLPFVFWLLTWRACAAVGRGWILIVLAIGSYAAHCCVMESLAIEQRSVVYTHSVLAHLPHLLLGVFVGQFLANVKPTSDLKSTQRRWLYDVLVVAVAAAMVAVTSASLDVWFQVPHGRYNFPYVPLLIAVGIAAVPRSNLALRLLETQLFRFLGRISFGVYVYHYSLMQLTAKIIRGLGAVPEENWLAFAAISLVLTLAAATASYHWLELPLFRWFARENNAVSQAESSTVPPKAARKLVNCL